MRSLAIEFQITTATVMYSVVLVNSCLVSYTHHQIPYRYYIIIFKLEFECGPVKFMG